MMLYIVVSHPKSYAILIDENRTPRSPDFWSNLISTQIVDNELLRKHGQIKFHSQIERDKNLEMFVFWEIIFILHCPIIYPFKFIFFFTKLDQLPLRYKLVTELSVLYLSWQENWWSINFHFFVRIREQIILILIIIKPNIHEFNPKILSFTLYKT